MTYQYYKKVIASEEMPLALVDLDVLEENIQQILARARQTRIRVATKSVRSVPILRRLLDASPQIQGLMCYTAREAVWLSEKNFDDLLVAYPTVHPEAIRAVAREVKKGTTIYLMADLPEHLELINKVALEEQVTMPVCVDLDLSIKFPGIHFGVHRSSITGVEGVRILIEKLKKCPNIRLAGLMGYEAQIAGIADNAKGKRLMNKMIRRLKRKSLPKIARRRKEAVDFLEENGITLDFVNGGGTGSIETTIQEDCVTEVTVGSGFYTSTLFDNYQNFRHFPAAMYAIEIVRQPQPDIYTCLGGGYVASGATGKDKVPKPHLPQYAKLNKNEMAGEVQTPIHYKGTEDLQIGDPIFLRHSKAGELCEHFKQLLLVSSGKIVERADTYRGEGQLFL